MLEILSKRLQKTIKNFQSKIKLQEEDILVIIHEIKLALLEADVNLKVVKEFVNATKKQALKQEVLAQLNPQQNLIKIFHEELTNVLGKKSKIITIENLPMTIMLVGLQGTGKTTTCGKLVNYLRKKKLISKALVIAADIYRPGAVEQLETIAKQLNFHVFTKKDGSKPQQIASEGLDFAQKKNYDLVIVDTAGRLAIDQLLMKELIDLKQILKPKEIFLVVDSFSGQDIINVANTFHQKLVLTSLIITKLDSDARGGAALSITRMLDLPIAFVGTSEKMSGLEKFHPERMAKRILGMGDILTLVEKIQENTNFTKTQKLTQRMIQGHFDLNDLLTQLRQIKKIGKISTILKLLPGMQNISENKINLAKKNTFIFEVLISSMTEKERKNPKLLKNVSRKKRILKGSGRSNQEYNLLVNEFEKMGKQMKYLSKSIKNNNFNGLGKY